MDPRERFMKTVRKEPVDRVPLLEEPLREDVLKSWHTQGLVSSVNENNYREYFDLDRYEYLYLSLEPLKGPLANKKDFARINKGYRNNRADFQNPGYWIKKAAEYGDRDFPFGLMGWRGFMLPLFTRDREWDSLNDVMFALHDFPEAIKETLEVVANGYIDGLKLAIQHMAVDFVMVSEPIASPAGPLISPAMFREFVAPCYRLIISFLHSHDISPVIFRSISNVSPLLPSVVDTGIDGLWLGQTADSIDYLSLRRRYKHLILVGGIDSRVLTAGEQAIEKEISRKVPPLLEQGRYIPTLDDNPRENTPYRSYLIYRDLLARACET